MAKKGLDVDNLFRENLSDFELSTKKGNWELMNHILNEDERKKKNRKWFLFIFLLVGLLLAGQFILTSDKEIKSITNDLLEPSKTAEAQNNSLHRETIKDIVTTTPNTPKEIEISNPAQNSQPILSHTNTSKPIEKSIHRNSEEKHVANHVKVATNKMSDTPSSQSELIVHSPEPYIPAINSDQMLIHDQPSSESIDPEQPEIMYSTNNKPSTQVIANEDSFNSDSSVHKSIEDDSLIKLAQDDVTLDSTLSTVTPQPKTKLIVFNLSAGANIYTTSKHFKNETHVSPLIGLELFHSLSSNFSLGLAGMYALQGGYHLNDTATQETYFFDRRISQQSIQIRQLHKFYFPLSIYYSISKSHIVSGAVQVSCLLNTKGNYFEINSSSQGTIESRDDNAKGYMDGIKPFNLALSLGYKYTISKRFDVSARVTREISEPYVEDYFYGINIKPTWSFQTLVNVKF